MDAQAMSRPKPALARMKAHDVRRLKVCDGCGGLGFYNPHLEDPATALIRTPSGRTLHPGCISEALLLKCAESELVTIRIADVGRELFERIADELMLRRDVERSIMKPDV